MCLPDRPLLLLALFALLSLNTVTGCPTSEIAAPADDAGAADDDRGTSARDTASDPVPDTTTDYAVPDLAPVDRGRPDVPDVAVEPDTAEEPEIVAPTETCDNDEDDDGDERADCHDPDCFDTDPCEGVPPAPWNEPEYWRLAWSDEFNGPEPGDEACYDNDTTPPQCLTLYWETGDCPEYALDNLTDLNKCNWSTFALYNWMDNGKPIGEGVNAFDPEFVTVTGGELILTSERRMPEVTLESGWTIGRVMEEYDCGNPPDTGYENSTDCPILSGGVWSKQMGEVTGLLQTYGRIEVRARLPVGPGSWPAHWMLPQEGPWPDDGEIDIMEAVNFQPDYHPFTVGANYHDGVETEIDAVTVNTHMSAGSMERDMSITEQQNEYHVYAVEWEADELRFFVDGFHIGTVEEGTMRPNRDLDTDAYVGEFPLEIPDEPFHVILNSTVAAFGVSDYPDPRSFGTQRHRIDFVRAWELCEQPADYCGEGETFDGSNCLVGVLPGRSDLFIHESSLVYPASAGSTECPGGGEHLDALCVVFAIDSSRYTFIEDGSFYARSLCVESTLAQTRCPNPCGGAGVYDGEECLIGSPPEGARGFVADDVLAYYPLGGDEPCPVGRDRSIWCEFGQIPEGRTGSVSFDGDAFMLDAICHPDTFMANCPLPCPEGSMFIGDGCLWGHPPAGTNPFISDRGFYYLELSTDDYAASCPIGTEDSTRCYVGTPPLGFVPVIRGGSFYVEPACDNVPPLD